MTETSKNQRLYPISAVKICEKSLKAAETRLTLNKKIKNAKWYNRHSGVVKNKY